MEVTLSRWFQLALSGLIIFRGDGLEISILAYFVSCKYRYAITSLGHAFSPEMLTYFAILIFSYILLRIIRCIQDLSQKSTIRNDTILRPCFFPCKTSHSRMFPIRHRFSYSYLLAGIPVGFKGSIGGLISVDEERKNSWFSRKSWFTVHGDDYLARGHHPGGLEGKLQDYLKTQVSSFQIS